MVGERLWIFDVSKAKRGGQKKKHKETQNTVPSFVHTLASRLSPSHKTPLPTRSRCSSVSSSVACSALREEWPVRVCVVQLRGRSAQLAASLCVSQSLLRDSSSGSSLLRFGRDSTTKCPSAPFLAVLDTTSLQPVR